MEEIKQNLPEKDDHNPATQNASDKKIYITPTGAVIAMIFFFMPWLKMSCMGRTQYASGADLGGVFWIIFAAAIFILLIFIYFKNQNQLEKAKPFVALSAVVSFLIILWKYVEISNGIKTEFGKITAKELGLSPQFGLFFTILGFIISLFGLIYFENESSTNSSDIKENGFQSSSSSSGVDEKSNI
ncbi:hypothetical protein ACX8XN_02150 [Calditrichota bacterium GD2]